MKELRSFRGAALGLVALLSGLGAIGPARESGQETGGERDALSASADAGRVLDREGTAARKGVLADRWGRVEEGTPVVVGDWLEVGTRGANALRVRMAGGAELILGPGTLVEATAGDGIAVLRGEVLVDASEDAAGEVTVSGPGETTIRVEGERAVLRARDGTLARLDDDPRWLVGYESNASTEALGSLLVDVDGRNVPLTIGYHKVTVDIRDQIARTVIEESFVNHTSTVLEGVFYFPLPAGSSISGFGMWIGNELVQGEIVEKQRAREIYETILRERRDPGLLEWTGGNIFKARVFPIGGEKRIRIAYTQVLPKKGDTYAYHYALESELLKKNPLGRLEIEVNVSSAEPIESVTVPSHECRIRTAEHSAKVELAAEEFAPDGDFELRVRTAPREGALTVIPHRRGDDGYFMLLIDAPDGPGEPDSGPRTEPIHLVVLADTSGSMHGAPRANQIAFVEALVSALGEGDTFELATADVETRWAFDRPRATTLENREEALRFLEARDALGWSDLGRAFDAAFERTGGRSGASTHVVYVGDGVPTSGDADPVALAHDLARRYRGSGTFHAVVPGSSSERVVLRALAGLGGGSVREIGGGTDPAQTAFALLEEIAAPAVKDLELSFEGLPVAAVYPEVLPNLTAGGQQIVVGRFDPRSGVRAGEVVLTGTLDGREVRLATAVALDGEDEGNSFIPRLWARHHLDHLLDEGSSSAIRERIVTLSEDFQIVTPYTSFLVLESDADRERFGVEKRFRMRDGEEFFTEGRESGRHELLREQMLAAKGWRKRLREGVLASLEDMRRELTELLRRDARPYDRLAAFGMLEDGLAGGLRSDLAEYRVGQSAAKERDEGFEDLEPPTAGEPAGDDDGFADEDSLETEAVPPASAPVAQEMVADRAMEKSVGRQAGSRAELANLGYAGRMDYLEFLERSVYVPTRGDAFAALFPSVPAPRGDAAEPTWSDEVTAILARLDRRAALARDGSGWRFQVENVYTDPRGRTQTRAAEHLVGPDAWLTLDAHVPGQAYGVHWVAEGRRGVLTEGWRLGRTRAARDGDLASWSAPFAWHFGDQVQRFAAYDVTVETLEDGSVRLAFSMPADPDSLMTLLVDVERGLVVEQTWSSEGEPTRGLRFDAFQEVGGLWWPGRIRSWSANAAGGAAETTTLVHPTSLAPEELTRLVAEELARRDDAILLGAEDPELADAKAAALGGDADLDQRFLLLRHFARTQRWDAARPHLAAFAELAAGAPGLDLVRATWLRESRRNEELRELLLGVAAGLAVTPRDADWSMAVQLLSFAGVLDAGGEVLELLEAMHPVFTRRTEIPDGELLWDQRRIGALANLGRPEVLFEAQREAAVKWPFVLQVQLDYATALARRGELDAALGWIEAVLAENGPWQPYERTQMRVATAGLLWNGYRLDELVRTFEAWEREDETQLSQHLFDQYVSALVYLDREREARERIDAWLALAEVEERTPPQRLRLQAAVQHALGQGWQLHHQRFEDERAEQLARVGRALALDDDETYVAGSILQHWVFRRTDAGRALLADLFAVLDEGVETLPARKLQELVTWLRGAGHRTSEPDAWAPIFERVLARWLASEDEGERVFLVQIVLGHAEPELRLRAQRRVLAEAETDADRVEAAAALFAMLLAQPWSEAAQEELTGLLDTLALPELPGLPGGDPDALSANVDRRILALYDLVSWTLDARTRAIVEGLPGFELLSRRTLQSERAKALRAVRAATAELLAGLGRALEPAALRDWAEIERLYLEIKNGSDLDAAWERALALLAARVEAFEAADGPHDVPLRDRVLAMRAIATSTHLVVRTDADALADRVGPLRALLERLVEADVEPPDGRAAVRDLLVVLDRGDELEATLAAWFGGGGDFAKVRWGREWAHVLAERGRLEEAAAVLEEIDALDELGPEDFEALGAWYTALDEREKARDAKVRSYAVMSEDELWDELYRGMHAYQRRGEGIPPELDPEVPVQLMALMRKARDPERRFHVLQGYYQATKDYRLLECIPAAVIGQTARRIYAVLDQVGGLARTIDEEASVDRIQAHLADLYERAETDVDRRALRLLQFQIVLRAARQAHGTERHAERALRAVGETFRTGWEDGEIALMAAFLARQGRLEPEALAEEQLRQLRELADLATDPDERLAVAQHLARALWSYGRADEAVRTLEAALGERRSVAGGRLPVSANEPLRELSGWLVESKSLRRAERLWLAELEADHPLQQALWLRLELYRVWKTCVVEGADVSLGRGEALYLAVVQAMQRDLATRTNEGHAREVVSVLCDLWKRAAERLAMKRVGKDAARFGFDALPDVLALYQYRGGQAMVGAVADLLREVREPRTALELLVARAEAEPSWLRLQNQDFWAQHGWRFGRCIAETGTLPRTLDERALAIVVNELREDLRTRQARSRTVYHQRYGYFWHAKRAVFLRTAIAFEAEHRDSPHAVAWTAEYLYDGLGARLEAIAMLSEAWRRGILHFDGRDLLARYLQEVGHWKESLPVVAELVADRPELARYRVMQMKAHFHVGDRDALVRAFEAAEAWLREAEAWSEPAIAELAAGCLETRLFEDSARLWDEAIALHARSSPNRGVGDGVLCAYYRQQSAAYSGLGRTADAVDAAAGAIVSWGRNIGQRRQELEQLVRVLAASEDLEGYVASLDAEVAETGLDNAIVRKALGQVYTQRDEPARAAEQLRRALLVRPDDLETHRLLVAALDAAGRPDLAADAQLDLARAAGHELGLYVDLGRRLAALERSARAERARTELIELSANESEGHQLLAGIREEQQRWEDAATHWRHVVRIRTNEPTGYLGLARALIELERPGEARDVIDHLRTTTWPAHFGDVRREADRLLRRLPSGT